MVCVLCHNSKVYMFGNCNRGQMGNGMKEESDICDIECNCNAWSPLFLVKSCCTWIADASGSLHSETKIVISGINSTRYHVICDISDICVFS